MTNYAEHMAKMADMTGWRPMSEAPYHKPVIVMDHAGNEARAVHDGNAWTMYCPTSPLLHGQRIIPMKWKD